MNKIFYALITLVALTSCASSYDISGTSNVSTLDGRMLYLQILKNNEFSKIDSCDVVHGQFHFQGTVDSVRMANVFMDDEPVLPLVLEAGSITVKLDDVQQVVSGTPLNDKLFGFFKKYQQLQNQQRELVHKHDQAIMNGSDMQAVTAQLNAEAMQLSEQEDKLVTTFITDNFENVLGPGVFFLNHGQPVSDAFAMDRGYHEQGYRALQERSIREGLLPESTGKPGYHERYPRSTDGSKYAGWTDGGSADRSECCSCTNA